MSKPAVDLFQDSGIFIRALDVFLRVRARGGADGAGVRVKVKVRVRVSPPPSSSRILEKSFV